METAILPTEQDLSRLKSQIEESKRKAEYEQLKRDLHDITYKAANTPKSILKLGLDGLKDHIKTIGLYNAKAENIIKTCDLLITHHNCEVPNTRKELEALPGVGRKTANVILNTLFGEPVIAVDTHIFRVSNRTNIAKGKTPLEVEKKLMTAIPKKYIHDAHHWLILHGRYICVARKPKCPICPIADLCEYPDKTEEL